MNKPEHNPELDRIRDIVRYNGPWTDINARLESEPLFVKRARPDSKKVFLIRHEDRRFVAVAHCMNDAEAQIEQNDKLRDAAQ